MSLILDTMLGGVAPSRQMERQRATALWCGA